jgi:glutamate-ammonia-ligase adenylyltransferase
VRKEFENVRFEDSVAAEQRLDLLLEGECPGLAEHLASALSETSAPFVALTSLERFLDASEAPDVELELVARDARYARLLCTLFDQSHFLTDILCRHPEYGRWLHESAVLRHARASEDIIADTLAELGECDSITDCARVMRHVKQREILRIATRDVFMHAPIPTLTLDLSNLADAMLETAYRFGARQLARRFGEPFAESPEGKGAPVAFVVIGMGKLGGHELNFSSDVDLLFIYTEDGEAVGGSEGSISCAEYFQKLGEIIIRLVSEQTVDGHIFRVDMRLRPHGRLSPLAASLDSTLNYYVQYGQAWERQALIKARPVAGDMTLGSEFIEQTRTFAFPRYFDDETLDSIRDIKQQMEAQIAQRGETGIEVKLGRGGIRDIEFTVQILQMLNGGRMPEFRTANTLDAIKALDTRGILGAFEATALASNYSFLRRVEHRLQIEGNQQIHVLPSDSETLDRFARKLGYQNGASFLAEYHDRTEETRAILNRFVSPENAEHQWVYNLLSAQSDGQAGMERLREYGFADPEKARRELLLLSAGPTSQPFPLHVRQQFAAIAPTLIAAMSSTQSPDATLVQLSRILSNLRAPSAIYDTLKCNPSLCGHLTTLVTNSSYLSDIIIRDPGLFDYLSSRDALESPRSREEMEMDLESLLHAYDSEAAPYRLHDGETLRVGLRELFQETTVSEVGVELALLAEVCLDFAVARAREHIAERYGAAQGDFAVLALGKLGGREMGYGSDLDLLFVYDSDAKIESEMAASEYFAAVAAHAMRILKEHTRYGSLYDVDARLRPDGNKGVLAANHRRLEEYFKEDAEPWERLALIKVRAVAGDAQFGTMVEERLRRAAFSVGINSEAVSKIEEIRVKIAQGVSKFDLKKDRGGLAEIEFAVRLLQLRHASRTPSLMRGDVLGAMDIIEKENAAPKEDVCALRDAYLLMRRIENRVRLAHGRSSSALPEDVADRAELGRRLGVEGDLEECVAAHKNRVHEIYQKVLTEVGSGD